MVFGTSFLEIFCEDFGTRFPKSLHFPEKISSKKLDLKTLMYLILYEKKS
jgi:hypothetical protein